MKPRSNFTIALILLICAGNLIIVGSVHSGWNVESSPTSVTLNDVWGASANEVFAVGAEETILYFDGTSWTEKNHSVDGANLRDVWGSSGSDVVAVGDNGTIWRYDGSDWKQDASGTTVNLHGVWVNTDGLAFVVGENDAIPPYEAVILYFNGTSWVTMDSNSSIPLKAVWGTSPSNVFAVGDSGTILRYDGSTWSAMNSGTTSDTLRCIWGSSESDVIAAGSSTNVYRYDGNAGNNWTQKTGVVEYPEDIWGSADNNVYAVGGSDAKTIDRFDGNTWTTDYFEPPDILEPPEFPKGVWGSSRYNIFAVGNNGMIVRYTQVHVQTVSPSNGALNVPVDASIRVTFSKNMAAASFRPDTFMVKDDAGNVTGSIDVTGSTVVFIPDADLSYGKTYHVMITDDVLDTDGDTLPANYRWFFETTRNVAPGASFPTQTVISNSADLAFSVYAADIDNDGDLDVLSASDDNDTVAWYANTDGKGTFSAPQIITDTATGARSVFAADIDNDGDADVLSASWGEQLSGNTGMEVAWYENAPGTQPLGTFGIQRIIDYHTDPKSVHAADLDNDDDMDVLSASFGDDTIAFYENDGTGTEWSTYTISTLADGAWDVFPADLDNDGDLDVLSASNQNNDVAWYENRLNESSADFGSQSIISLTADQARVVRAADMDQDGDMDVISASRDDGKIAWYPNLGGNFGDMTTNQNIIVIASVHPQAMHVADLDNDGDVDVLYGSWRDEINQIGAHKIIWMENLDGNGSAWESHILSSEVIGCKSLYTADLDGDGDLDVLSASQDDNKIAWYENKGSSTSKPPSKPINVSPVDETPFGERQTITLKSSPFSDADGDSHSKSYWEVMRADSGELSTSYDPPNETGLTSHVVVDTLDPGLLYKWRVRYEDDFGEVSEWSDRTSFKVGTSESERLPKVAAGQSVGDFGMISIVHLPNDPTPEAVFNITYDPRYYRIGTYDPENDRYIEFGDGLMKLVPGEAYWILAREGLVVNFDGIPVSKQHDIEISLSINTATGYGWNMFAPPNDAKYAWGDVKVGVWNEATQEFLTPVAIADLTDNTIIDRRVWEWKSGAYVFHNNTSDFILESYQGYWAKANKAGAYLVFPQTAQLLTRSKSDNVLIAVNHKVSNWLKKLAPKFGQAIADNDTPPMPMGTFADSDNENIFKGCFVTIASD